MSAIPVRRTTRAVRSNKDNENANARPRVTTRSKSAIRGGTAAPAAGSRATASTAASKAKSSAADITKEAAGAKRKREVLVEVTGLLTNNNKTKNGGGAGASKDVEKLKDTAGGKSKASTKPPGKLGKLALSKRVARAPSEGTTVSKGDSETTLESKSSLGEHADEPMEIDSHLPAVKEVPPNDEDESRRVFKKRHTEEHPVIPVELQDESQVEADRVAAELQATEISTAIQEWDDLDAEDWDDPVMVSEYVVDISVYLKEIEVATLPNPDYMEQQPEITWEHRGVLVDWLLQVHAKFGLTQESLFLTVNVLDRFLGMRTISISKLQLVGLACFFIATKFEETYAPSVKEIAYLADDQYTLEEILKAEKYILRTIEWDLRAPGPMGWLRRGSKADDCEVHARTIAKYLIEIACLERKLIGMVPSLVAATALWLARLTLGREEWTANLRHYTTYSEEQLIPTANIMLEYIITDPVPHESLYKKYAHKRNRRCSTFMRQWSLERWPDNGNVNLSMDLEPLKQDIREYRALVEAQIASGELVKEEEIEV